MGHRAAPVLLGRLLASDDLPRVSLPLPQGPAGLGWPAFKSRQPVSSTRLGNVLIYPQSALALKTAVTPRVSRRPRSGCRRVQASVSGKRPPSPHGSRPPGTAPAAVPSQALSSALGTRPVWQLQSFLHGLSLGLAGGPGVRPALPWTDACRGLESGATRSSWLLGPAKGPALGSFSFCFLFFPSRFMSLSI